jgi:hypothetical protein
MPISRRSIVVGAAAAATVSAAGVATLLIGRPAYDPSYDVSVSNPAHADRHPTILFDEGHRNAHLTTTGYRPLVQLLRNDGYRILASSASFTPALLATAQILLINGARGRNDANDGPAFHASEEDAVEDWVRHGGSLLLITDHWPFASPVAGLSRRFGVEIGGGMTADARNCEASLGETHIVYSRANGLLADHPIVNGRNGNERVTRALTFTGQSLSVPPGAVAFLRLGDRAIDYPPTTPRIVRDGGDVRVSMTYGEPVSAAARAQGVALEASAGRVCMLAETGMLRAQRAGSRRVGMNLPGYDNRQLALNILHWLSRLI